MVEGKKKHRCLMSIIIAGAILILIAVFSSDEPKTQKPDQSTTTEESAPTHHSKKESILYSLSHPKEEDNKEQEAPMRDTFPASPHWQKCRFGIDAPDDTTISEIFFDSSSKTQMKKNFIQFWKLKNFSDEERINIGRVIGDKNYRSCVSLIWIGLDDRQEMIMSARIYSGRNMTGRIVNTTNKPSSVRSATSEDLFIAKQVVEDGVNTEGWSK